MTAATGASGDATHNSGTTGLIAAGGSDSSSIAVGVDTSTAGAKSGSVTLTHTSDGTGTSNLGTIGAGSSSISVSGNVYRTATAGVTPNPVSIANQHVGGTNSAALTVANTAATDGFSEGLVTSATGASGDAMHNGGTTGLIAAGASDNSSISVGVSTATAGAKSGTVTLTHTSDGTGTSNLGTIGAGSSTVSVTGNVYRYATGSATPSSQSLGAFHVGQSGSLTGNVTVANTAAGDGFSDKLGVTGVGATGTGFGATNGVAGPIAGGSSDNGVAVSFNTASGVSGVNNGSVQINTVSDGTAAGLGTTVLDPMYAAVTAEGYNYANAVFKKDSGSGIFTGGATSYTLNLGSVTAGSGTYSTVLDLVNALAAGGTVDYTDLLSGTYSVTSGSGFSLTSGWGPVTDLIASADPSMGLSFNAATAGSYSETVTFQWQSHNVAGLGDGGGLTAMDDITLTFLADVQAGSNPENPVPEPTTLGALFSGLAGLFIARRRRAKGKTVN